MVISHGKVNSWKQESLLPPPVVKVLLKVGVWTETGDVLAQVEAYDETSGDLLAMIAWPTSDVRSVSQTLAEAVSNVLALINEYRGPFPHA
jgi:hypothetical protein